MGEPRPITAQDLLRQAVQTRLDDIVTRVHHAPGSNGGPTSGDPEAVIDHILFHKALADHDPDRLSEYLTMARQDVASFRDPFDRAIALTFHLVVDEQMDPWSIDLGNFSTLYAERIRSTPEVDLITGGKLLALAWHVLLRQTQGLLERAQPPEPEPEEPMWDLGWDDFPEAWGDQDEGQVYTERVLDEQRDPPLSESVFHQGDRRVTLFELVEALEDGRREAERRKILARERAKARAEQADIEQDDVQEKVHKEDLEAEIHNVRERLKTYGEEVALHQVYDGTREDFLTVFIASLFLSRAEMIDIRQESFPHSPILIQGCAPLHDPNVPLVGIPKTGPEAADALDEDGAEAPDEDAADPPAEDEAAAPSEAAPDAPSQDADEPETTSEEDPHDDPEPSPDAQPVRAQ